MSDVIIILAGGESKRFDGVPKYNLPVCGEPVIERTVRLCREFRPDIDPHVERRNLTYNGDPSHTAAFLALRELWSQDGTTYLMFGDVSWNRGCLREFLGQRGYGAFGRFVPNVVTGNPHPECYGVWFDHRFTADMERWHKLALLCHPNGDWWDVAGFVVRKSLIPPRLASLVPPSIRRFFWFRCRCKIDKVCQSPMFVDVGSTATDDFDYPWLYKEYVKNVTKELLEAE